MKIVLTVVLAAIFLAAVWSGYRRGLILSAAQLAAIVVALYGAALLAGLFSDRLLPVAEPFAGGYFEGQLDVVATELPDNDAGLSGEDWVAAHPDTAQEYAEQCFAAAGVTGRPARRMASAALAMRDEQDITLRAAMTQVYCARLCYVLVTSVGFLLILLILAAIGNLPNLAFQLPNREKLNDIGGAAFGAVNGVCFGILLCWALQFAGPVIGRAHRPGKSAAGHRRAHARRGRVTGAYGIYRTGEPVYAAYTLLPLQEKRSGDLYHTNRKRRVPQ